MASKAALTVLDGRGDALCWGGQQPQLSAAFKYQTTLACSSSASAADTPLSASVQHLVQTGPNAYLKPGGSAPDAITQRGVQDTVVEEVGIVVPVASPPGLLVAVGLVDRVVVILQYCADSLVC